MDPRLPSLAALNGRITPSLSSFILSSRLREVMLATHGPSAASRLGVWSIRRPCSETPPLRRPPLLIASAPGWRSRSRRMPGKPLDAPDDLQKESRCQVALGQLEPEGPGVPNEAATGLEQPLLEAREGPALDGERQDQPALQSMTHQCIGVGSMETKRYRLKIATWTVVREPWQPSPRKLDSPEAVVELARRYVDVLNRYPVFFADLDSRPLRGIARRALPCLRDEKRHYQPGAAPPAPPGLREDRCRQTRGGEAGMRGREAALGEGRDTP